MEYFNGFCLRNEEELLAPFIQERTFDIYGFSYGAIKAFWEAKKRVENFERVDRLVLLSPAFFQTRSEKFKKLQMRMFERESEKYVENFLHNCFAPYKKRHVSYYIASAQELKELLWHEWSLDELLWLRNRGVAVEVYLGGKDAIIDPVGAYELFKEVADVTFIKDANHFLLSE